MLCLSTDSAFCFGYYGNGSHIVGKKAEKDGHIAVFGGSGTGKTTSIALPTIFTWQGSKFVIDLKGDMIGWGIAIGAKFLFLLEGYRNDHYYDPFDFLRKGGRSNVNTNALEIANILIPFSTDPKENYWIEAAQGVLAAIVYYFKLGLDFIETMLMVKTRKMLDLIKTIKAEDSEAALCLSGDIIANPQNAAIISTELHNHISVFVNDPVIQEALSQSESSPKKLI